MVSPRKSRRKRISRSSIIASCLWVFAVIIIIIIIIIIIKYIYDLKNIRGMEVATTQIGFFFKNRKWLRIVLNLFCFSFHFILFKFFPLHSV